MNSTNLIKTAFIKTIESKNKNIEDMIKQYENQVYKPPGFDPNNFVTKEELDEMIKIFDSQKIDPTNNNDNSNKDDNENSEYNKEKKKPPISYNKLYEFTGFNIKIFKLINRSSKKNTISFQV